MQSKFVAFVAAAALGALLVTGCSKSADSTSSTDTSSPAASAAPAAGDAPAAAAPAATTDGSAAATSAPAMASAGDVTKGAAIFSANCQGCHGAAGAGGGIGPKLVGEKSRKDTAAAIAWIKNPVSPMPKLYPSPLSEKDVADVAAYVESL